MSGEGRGELAAHLGILVVQVLLTEGIGDRYNLIVDRLQLFWNFIYTAHVRLS
jgi:hypothetical protein